MKKIRLGTRTSRLALIQADLVKTELEKLNIDVEIIKIISTGDKITDKPLWDIGGKGLFCKELDIALLSGDIDIAVHSAKDMETKLADGTEILAVLPRQNPNDVFVSDYTIGELPSGSVVGTCSPRRKSQLLTMRNDLKVESIRGNVDTRLQKIKSGEYTGTFLAMAGLNRLNVDTSNWQELPYNDFIPSAGQGIIVIQGKKDCPIQDIMDKINDKASFLQLQCERAFLSGIDGGCTTPIGAYAEINGKNLTLHTFYDNEKGDKTNNKYEIIGQNLEQQCFDIGKNIKNDKY